MKKLIALIMAALMLAACVPALAWRPVQPPAGGGGSLSGGDGASTVPTPTEPTVRPAPQQMPFNPDSDYDGIPDFTDSAAKSNTFAATVFHTKPSESINASYSYDYTWDYSWLIGDPASFNSGLCHLSSLIAGLGYHQNGSDISSASDDLYRVTSSVGSQMTLPQFMQAHGMRVREVNLITQYDDNHLTLVDLGLHRVVWNDKQYDVMLIAMRGSNGTWAEWNSNFEIGHDLASCEPELTPFKYGVNPYWTNSANHMGFDVAANRVLAAADAFAAEFANAPDGVIYWVTGHSRGGAIANLVSAKLSDRGETVFGYTFACPNTTLSANASSYRSIFNIVNEDDLVAYLPFTDWGYHRYGRSAVIDMSSGMQSTWQSMMGEGYDHAESTLTNALEKMSGIASCRNDCYTYTCSCHGNGTDDDIMTSNWYFTKANREKAIAKTPACLAPYYKLELEDATFYWTYHCQPPIFFMQYLACYMAGQMTTLEFGDYDVADKYESAKWALATAAAMGVGHPHYCESYFIIADNVGTADFN